VEASGQFGSCGHLDGRISAVWTRVNMLKRVNF